MPTLDEAKLKESLMKDLSEAQEMANKTATGLGLGDSTTQPSSFSPRAIRIAGKAVGQSEIRTSQKAIEKAVRELSGVSGITDSVQMAKFQGDLKNRLHRARLLMMDETNRIRLQLAKLKLDKQTEQRTMSAVGKAGASIIAGIVAGIGLGPAGGLAAAAGVGSAMGGGDGGGGGGGSDGDEWASIEDPFSSDMA